MKTTMTACVLACMTALLPGCRPQPVCDTWSWHPLSGLGEADSVRGDIAAIEETSDGVLFVASYRRGLARSTDGGGSWTTFLAGTADLRDIRESRGGELFAIDYDAGVLRSSDRGTTWSMAITGRYMMSVLPVQDGSVLVNGQDHLFRVGIRGEVDTLAYPGPVLFRMAVDSAGHIYGLPVGVDTTLYVLMGSSKTWERRRLPEQPDVAPGIPGGVTALAAGRDRELLLARTDATYRSTDGGLSWSMMERASGSAGPYLVGFGSDGCVFAVSDGGDLFVRRGRANWRLVEGKPRGVAIAKAVFGPAGVFVALSNGALFQCR